MTFAQAQLQEIDAKSNAVGTAVPVQFNPTTLKLQMTTAPAAPKASSGQVAHYLGSNATLTFELVFDTSEEGTTASPVDVRERTATVRYFLMPSRDSKKPPPRVRFEWGSFHFTGVMTSVGEDIDLFAASGTPLHAKLSVSITEQDEARRANASGPGARSGAGAKAPSLGLGAAAGFGGGAAAGFGGGASAGFGGGAAAGFGGGAAAGFGGGAAAGLGGEASAGFGGGVGAGFGGGAAAGFGAEAAADFGAEATASFGGVAGAGFGGGAIAGFDAGTGAGFAGGGVADRVGVTLGGESLPDFAARNGIDPEAWRALSAGIASPLTLPAGATIAFAASVTVDGGIGVQSGAQAGIGASPTAAFGLDPGSSGTTLAAAGGLRAASESVSIVTADRATGSARAAFGLRRAPAPSTPQPAPPDQRRAPLFRTGLPTAAQATAAPARPAPPLADARATTYGTGVPLRPRLRGLDVDGARPRGGWVVLSVRDRPMPAPRAHTATGGCGCGCAGCGG